MTDKPTEKATVMPFGMTPEIAAAVCAVKSNIKRLKKADKNKFDNYNFTSIDAFLEFVNPLCAEAGLLVMHDEVDYDYYTNKKESLWVRVSYHFYLCHTSGAVAGPFRRCVAVPMNGAQAYGSAQSYALKQFLRGQFMIPTGDKDDADLNATDDHQTAPKTNRKQQRDPAQPPANPFTPTADAIEHVITTIGNIDDLAELGAFWHALKDEQPGMQSAPGVAEAKDEQKAALDAKADTATEHPPQDDGEPY